MHTYLLEKMSNHFFKAKREKLTKPCIVNLALALQYSIKNDCKEPIKLSLE